MVRERKTQRIFDIADHKVSFKQVKKVEETQFTAMAKQGPDSITKCESWVEVTAQCDKCFQTIEITLDDDNSKISKVRRYIFGRFAEYPCIDRKV